MSVVKLGSPIPHRGPPLQASSRPVHRVPFFKRSQHFLTSGGMLPESCLLAGLIGRSAAGREALSQLKWYCHHCCGRGLPQDRGFPRQTHPQVALH